MEVEQTAEEVTTDVESTEAIVDAPVEETQEVTPDAIPEATPEVPAEELYELPDGTKVNAEVLSKEWRDNFMPVFTRSRQELSALKKGTPQEAPKQEEPAQPKWKDPNWVPQTYEELATQVAEGTKREIYAQILEENGREERERQQRDNYVQGEIAQIQAIDPKANINVVMTHASKYAFSSLVSAYQNMKAIDEAVKRTEDRVLKNVKQRAGEPVGTGSADPTSGITFPSDVRTGPEKARWILRNK